MDTPIIFMVFNRPQVTEKVLERIRLAQPKQITIVSDGPRSTHPEDAELVAATRNLVEQGIDWPCDVQRDYAEQNLGCGPRVASGITNAFSYYDRAIILEDDTVPVPSFFTFCETMLNRYAEDENVTHVSGSNIPVGLRKSPGVDGYCLNHLPDIWGWATWSRAWNKYDLGIKQWGEVSKTDWLDTLVAPKEENELFRELFNKQYELEANILTWDWSWIYTSMRNGLAVTPLKNLVTNIGFGVQATNTISPHDELANLPSSDIDLGQLTSPRDDLANQLDTLLLAYRFEGNKLRRHKSILGRLRSGRLIRKAKYYLGKLSASS